MRILGLTPCFFPVCEGLGGGWDFQDGRRRRRRRAGGGDPITITITITITNTNTITITITITLESRGETLESKGGDPRMGVLEYGVGWEVGVLEYGKKLRPQNWVWDRFLVPIFHDGDKYWTIWAETFSVHTNFSRRFQWKYSGRPQTLYLTQT